MDKDLEEIKNALLSEVKRKKQRKLAKNANIIAISENPREKKMRNQNSLKSFDFGMKEYGYVSYWNK